jgi:exopolysaccharide production protein ExoQ
MLGAGLILATNHRAVRGQPARVRVLCLGVVLAGVMTFLLTGHDEVANALGRTSNLSGRTEIWAVLIPTVANPLVGAGFESYWISSSVEKVWSELLRAGWWHPERLVTEAHNGYIEFYLNLGWIGIALIATMLITGYRRAIASARRCPSMSSMALAYVMASALYSITEAGFRMLDPIWFFLLLAVVTSSAIVTGIIRPEVTSDRENSRETSAEMLVPITAVSSIDAAANNYLDRPQFTRMRNK